MKNTNLANPDTRRFNLKWLAAGALAIVAGAFSAGCDRASSPPCSADPSPAESAVLLDLNLDATAGNVPFELGADLTSEAGVPYSVSMLRFYVSHVTLVDQSGTAAPAVLSDASGKPLEYGVALVDYAEPESKVLHVLAPPGKYASLALSLGVPKTCDDGGTLNHEDASERSFPLNVDADMYWGWDPGYVFFKIEGKAITPEGAKSFLFHMGDDDRYTTVSMPAAFEVTGPAAHHVTMDVNRLFTTPSGDASPDMTGERTSNAVHGGAEADTMADNCAGSEVFQWSR